MPWDKGGGNRFLPLRAMSFPFASLRVRMAKKSLEEGLRGFVVSLN
jgi:hypothetical protein